jgi:ABC-type multidrug transport system fused ATPase/permease subunit
MIKIINIIRENIKNLKLIFMTNIFISILSSISYLGITLSIQSIISVAGRETDYTLLNVSIFALCALIYYALMNIFSELLKGHLEISIEQKIRTDTLNTLFKKTILSLQKMHSGVILTRLTDDVRNVSSFIVNVSSQLVLEIFTAVLATIYMFILSWKIALIMVFVIP